MSTNGLIVLSTAIGAGFVGYLVSALSILLARVRREPISDRTWETWFED